MNFLPFALQTYIPLFYLAGGAFLQYIVDVNIGNTFLYPYFYLIPFTSWLLTR